jgi:hypothetical protein
MTVALISVGISLLEALDDPRHNLARTEQQMIQSILTVKPQRLFEDNGTDDPEKASHWLAGALAAEDDAARNQNAADRLGEYVAGVQPSRWPSRLSAELETFDAMPGRGIPHSREDVAVLICSDTVRGMAAGLWNAAVLTGGDLTRVSYLPGPDRLPREVSGRVLIARIPGLDAGTEAGFVNAMRGLGVLAKRLIEETDVGPAESFDCYLSGGFKAAIPYLIGLAEGIRSLEGDRQVRAWVRHGPADPSSIAAYRPRACATGTEQLA